MSLVGYHVRLEPEQVDFLRSLENASRWLRTQVDRGKAEVEAVTPGQRIILLAQKRAELLQKIKRLNNEWVYTQAVKLQEKRANPPKYTKRDDFIDPTADKLVSAVEYERARIDEEIKEFERQIDDITL